MSKQPDYSFISDPTSSLHEDFVFLEVGQLVLTSGQLVACDPFAYPETLPFSKTFHPGAYPVTVISDSGRVVCAFVRFNSNKAVRWVNATQIGEDLGSLEMNEILGYPVETATGCFMDVEVAHIIKPRIDADYKAFLADVEKENTNRLPQLVELKQLNARNEELCEQITKLEKEVEAANEQVSLLDKDIEEANEQLSPWDVDHIVSLSVKLEKDPAYEEIIKMLTEGVELPDKFSAYADLQMPQSEGSLFRDKLSLKLKLNQSQQSLRKEEVSLRREEVSLRREQLEVLQRQANLEKEDGIRAAQAAEIIVLDSTTGLNLIAFRSGWGDGFYPSFFGYDEDGEVCAVVTDFVGLGFPDEEDAESENGAE